MSTLGRLKKMKTSIEMNKDLYVEIPKFEEWDEKRLNQYIIAWYNGFTKENNLNTYEDEETLLKKWLSKDLIKEDEYNLMIDAIKEIWRQKNEHIKATGETGGIFFIDSD